MKVVIVESPSKAKTINRYLGKDYDVYASFGHVRDLPAKDGSVDPDDDFAMLWEVDGKSAKRLSEIANPNCVLLSPRSAVMRGATVAMFTRSMYITRYIRQRTIST